MNTIKTSSKSTTYEKLPVKFKNNWISALRSGKYKQSQGSLRNNQGYCCLGVAAKVCEIGEEHITSRTMLLRSTGKGENKVAWNKIRTRIPRALRDNKGVQSKLAIMNDTNKSFKYIANWIQRNL